MSGNTQLLLASAAPVLTAYATWNPLDKAAAVTLSNGDLSAETSGVSGIVRATQGKAVGKWYWEITCDYGSGFTLGIADTTLGISAWVGSSALSWGYYGGVGTVYNNGTPTAGNSTYIAGDIVGFALDAGLGTLDFYLNGVLQPVGVSGIPAGTYYPANGNNVFTGSTINFGATPFAYSVPVGYNAGLYDSASPLIYTVATSSQTAAPYFFTLPAYAIGDMLIAYINSNIASVTGTPTGWAEANNGAGQLDRIFWRVADGTEGSSVSWVAAGASPQLNNVVLAVKGITSVGGFSWTGHISAYFPTITAPSVAPVSVPSTLLQFFSAYGGLVPTYTENNGVTEIVDVILSPTSIAAAAKALTTLAPTGATIATMSVTERATQAVSLILYP